MNTEPAMRSDWLTQVEPVLRKIYLDDVARQGLFEAEARRVAPPPSPWRLYVGIGCCIVLPLIAIGVGLVISHMVASRAARRRRDALLDPVSIANGRVRMAYPLMFNSMFMRGEVQEAPGLVLIVDDDGPDISFDDSLDLITRISFASPRSKDPIERRFAALMSDERYAPQRRTRIDPSVTNGRVIYAAHLMANRAELVADLDTYPMIPCFIGRGDHAITRVVPAHIVAGFSDALAELDRRGVHPRGSDPETGTSA